MAWAGCNSRSDTPHHARRLRLVTNSDTASYTASRSPSVRPSASNTIPSMTLRSADGLSTSHSLLANTLVSGSGKSDGFTLGTLAVFVCCEFQHASSEVYAALKVDHQLSNS